VDAVRRREDAWGRLAWQVPLATVLTLLGLMAFLRLLEPADAPPPAPRPLDVEVAELAPSPVAPPPAAPKAPARPTPPPEPERRPVEIRREPIEPPPAPVPAVSPAAVGPLEPPVPPRPAGEARDAIPAPPAAVPQPAAPSPAIAKGTSTPDSDRARAPVDAARDPAPGSRGDALGGGNAGARAIYQPVPEIPVALRHRSLEIVAVARFKVAANGSVQVELTEPTADSDLNRAVLESLRRWRFFPAMQDGKPVASIVEIRIPISVR
jgi:periplasmic protein TonB